MTRPVPVQTVLVVEDEPELREVLCHVLNEPMVRAVGVRDGRAALDYLEREPAPAAIILDLLLPELDGCQVLDWIRLRPALAGVPVLVISAAPRDKVTLALQHPGASFLPKPLDAVRLVRTVRRAVGLDADGRPRSRAA